MAAEPNVVRLLAALVALASFTVPLMRQSASEYDGFRVKGTIAGTMSFVFLSPVQVFLYERVVSTPLSPDVAFMMAVLWVVSSAATMGFLFLLVQQLAYSDEQIGYFSCVLSVFVGWLGLFSLAIPALTAEWVVQPLHSALWLLVAGLLSVPSYRSHWIASRLKRTRWDLDITLSPPR